MVFKKKENDVMASFSGMVAQWGKVSDSEAWRASFLPTIILYEAGNHLISTPKWRMYTPED